MMNDRRLQVLRAIVEDYVDTRDPVGSKAVTQRHDLGVSSATIRNDMAFLEEEGLLVAPHTSAGRIPTEKGYRLFVDKISEVKPLSLAEKEAISVVLDKALDLDDVLEVTVRILAQLTRKVAVLQYPVSRRNKVRHVEFVSLCGTKILVVLVTETGGVQQRIVELCSGFSEDFVLNMKFLVNDVLVGKFVSCIVEEVVGISEMFLGEDSVRAGVVLECLNSFAVLEKEERLLLAGTANLARSNLDFSQTIEPILEALEEQVVILRLLDGMAESSHGVAINIGSENCYAGFRETSVVATGYAFSSVSESKIGVLGPTRMDYPNSIAAVCAVARYLSKILST